MAGPYDDLIGFLNTQHTELNAEKDKLAKIDDNKKRFQEELLALSTERKQAESRIEKLEENLRPFANIFHSIDPPVSVDKYSDAAPSQKRIEPAATSPSENSASIFGKSARAHNAKIVKPAQVNATYPSVIDYQGRWVEIRCKHCGANASPHQCHFFNGHRGMRHHVRQAHKTDGGHMSIEEYCSIRPISARDIELMSMSPPQPPKDSPIEHCYGSQYCNSCSAHKAHFQMRKPAAATTKTTNDASISGPTRFAGLPTLSGWSLPARNNLGGLTVPPQLSDLESFGLADKASIRSPGRSSHSRFESESSREGSPNSSGSVTPNLGPVVNGDPVNTLSGSKGQAGRAEDDIFAPFARPRQTARDDIVRSSRGAIRYSISRHAGGSTASTVYDQFQTIEKQAKTLSTELKPRRKRHSQRPSHGSKASEGGDGEHEELGDGSDDEPLAHSSRKRKYRP